MITNLHHIAILTSNMEDAIEYYTNLLGGQKPRISEVNRPGVKLIGDAANWSLRGDISLAH